MNCHFDPWMSLEAVALMKAGLEKAGIKKPLMVQPLGFATPDCGKQGFIDLPEFPFGECRSYSCIHVKNIALAESPEYGTKIWKDNKANVLTCQKTIFSFHILEIDSPMMEL